MKYLRLFEDHNTEFNETDLIEDILTPFIDDKLCLVERYSDHYIAFRFVNQIEFENAIERIKKNNLISYTYINKDIHTVLSFSKQIISIYTDIFKTLKDTKNAIKVRDYYSRFKFETGQVYAYTALCRKYFNI